VACQQTVVNPSQIGVANVRCVNPLHHFLTSAIKWRVMSIMTSHYQTVINWASVTTASGRAYCNWSRIELPDSQTCNKMYAKLSIFDTWARGRQLWMQTSGCELCLRVHTVQQEAQKNMQYKRYLKCEKWSVSVIIMFVRTNHTKKLKSQLFKKIYDVNICQYAGRKRCSNERVNYLFTNKKNARNTILRHTSNMLSKRGTHEASVPYSSTSILPR